MRQAYRMLLPVAAVAAPAAGWAATTGQVVITAAVPQACNIVVSATAGASIANLSLGDTNRNVAVVTEDCNDPNGYTVDMLGVNSGSYTGKFVDSVSGDEHPFTVRYDNTSVGASRITDVNLPAQAAKNVDITYAADATLTATSGATYAETLGFTITAK